MAKAINRLTYIISGFCFSIILVVGVSYIKFLSMNPGNVTVSIIQEDSKNYASIVLEKHTMCDALIDYPYSKLNYFVSNNKIVMPIETHTTFIPLSIKYDCKFLVFHKMGTELVYAQIN